MFDIIGPAGPLMYPDQIFCYSTYVCILTTGHHSVSMVMMLILKGIIFFASYMYMRIDFMYGTHNNALTNAYT